MIRYIKDRTGKVLGWFEDIGKKTYIHNYSGVMQGWYDHETNTTHDYRGTLIGWDNQLMTLLSN